MENISFKEWSDRWDESQDMGPAEYIGEQLHPDVVLTMAPLFFPNLMEKDGLVFLEEHFSEEVYQSLRSQHPSDSAAIENGINRVYLLDIFSHNGPHAASETLEEAGSVLRDSWDRHVHHVFPGKKFNVSLDIKESNYGPALSLVQIS